MTADNRELRDMVMQQLPAPSHLEFVAARDRVLHELRATPPHLQRARLADPPPTVSWLRTALPLAAAAALIAMVAAVSLRNGEWLAIVEAADGSTYRLEPNEVVRAGAGAGAMLTLVDGSRVEMRAASALSLERAADGLGIRFEGGDIIVNAQTRRDGRLYVRTKDVTVEVAGTAFVATATTTGSRVAVIEGEARVREGTVETRLGPGERVSTSPVLSARPLRDDITWSRNAGAHMAILESFAKGIAQTAGPLTPLPRQADAGGAQTPGAPASAVEFEEASIRACDPDNLPPLPQGTRGGGANSVLATPGRWYALCLTPATMIRLAYGYRAVNVEALLPDGPLLPNGQQPPRGGRAPLRGRFGVVGSLGMEDGSRIRGGPDWVRKEQFTIEAVASGTPDSATMSGPMLRALLERRFKLKTHVETEQTKAFNLVVAPGGLKIKPVASGACEVPPPNPGRPLLNGMPQLVVRPPNVAAVRSAAKPPCGLANGPNGPNWVSVGGEAALGALTQMLRMRMPRGVGITDKTGVTGLFNWDLEFATDANAPGQGDGGSFWTESPADAPRAPTVFEALEQQLGLRLEPVLVPREFLVIDSIERPGAN